MLLVEVSCCSFKNNLKNFTLPPVLIYIVWVEIVQIFLLKVLQLTAAAFCASKQYNKKQSGMLLFIALV